MRSPTRLAGAHQPIAAKFGSKPIMVEAAPMTTSDTTKSALRPMRSPRCPAIMPPRGRARNPTAKVAKEASVLPSSEPDGKNCTRSEERRVGKARGAGEARQRHGGKLTANELDK